MSFAILLKPEFVVEGDGHTLYKKKIDVKLNFIGNSVIGRYVRNAGLY